MDMNTRIRHIVYIPAILLAMLLLLSGCRDTASGQVSNTSRPPGLASAEQNYDAQILGVVKNISPAEGKITLYDTKGQKDLVLSYTGGTDITDQYGQIIAISQMNLGEMVDAFYGEQSEMLVKMQISRDAWEYEGVTRFDINKTKKIFQIADNKYRYTEDLVISDGQKTMLLMDINDKDELTLKGVGGAIYSATVTKGHGYIRLSGYDAFMGGYLEVGYDIFTTVTDNMLLVVREGKYDVTLKKGELEGRKTVNVAADQEVKLDMSEYYVEPERVGHIRFNISPEGSDLYVNEALTDYEEDVELNYGEYDIRVTMDGYEEWTGILTVASSYDPIEILLANKMTEPSSGTGENADSDSVVGNENEIVYEEENENLASPEPEDHDIIVRPPSPVPSPGAADSALSQNTGSTPVPNRTDSQAARSDSDHTITITSPVAAQVYVNGTYKGTSPVSFAKALGNLTITLCREGYTNKSYSVDTIDDKRDVSYSFPDLDKSKG